MKILIFGGAGMLGHKLVQILRDKFDVYYTFRKQSEEYAAFKIFEKNKCYENVDVSDHNLVKQIIGQLKPDYVINCVGIIKQIPKSKDVITTLQTNSIFPHQLANFSEPIGAKLITISTDCVFDGARGFYNEEDLPNAADLYGKSKNLGEVTEGRHLTLRTSIIGRELNTSHSLVEWFLSNRGKEVRGFVNALYTGFPTIVLADIISDLIENHRELNGLYHVSSEPINKYDLLNLLKKYFNVDIQIERFEDFVIDRTLDSRKFRTQTNFRPQNWEKMIERMVRDRTPYENWRR